MTELFIKIYKYFHNHRMAFWLSMVASFVFFGYFSTQIHLEEDINKLMPSSKNEDGSTKLAFADLRIKDKTFLLFEAKNNTKKDTLVEQLSETCDAFIDSLKVQNEALDSTHQVLDDVFYQLPDELMFDAIDYLNAHLPSFIDTSVYAHFDTLLTAEHMQRQMKQNHEDLTSEFGETFPDLIQMDPIGMRNLLLEQMKPFMEGSSGSYNTINNHFFVPDSTVCIAIITPRFSATNTGQGSTLFRILNEQIKLFEKSHPNVKITYHGTPASGYYNSTVIKSDLTGTIIGSLILVLIFIFICFRNWNTLPLLLLPVAFGAMVGLTAMYFIKGQFSLLALGIGAIVLGVALSYVLHVLTHFKYVNDPELVLRDQVKPVLLGCITTIGSFLGLIFIQTDLLQDFGLFAAFAISGTTLFSLIFLPQMLNPKHNKINHRAFAWIDRINAYPFDQKKPLVFGIVVVALVCIGFYIVGGTHFDADMHDLGYEAENTTYSENLLRNKTYTGDKQKYFASSGKTMEEAIENFQVLDKKLDSLQQLGLVKSYTHTNQIFVPQKVQQQRIDAWKNYWTSERQQRVRQLIAQTAPQADLNAEAFDVFFDAATANYEPDAFYQAGIIPVGYQSTLMEQSYNGDYLCFTSVRCANDSIRSSQSDYIRICDAVANTPNLLVLDTYYYTTDTLNQLNDDFNVLQWISMLFVFLVLLFSFRFNIKYTLLGFMPILMSWLIVLGAMVIFKMQFNLINIIISTFIFGIGVDYSIFVMNGLIDNDKDSKKLAYHKTAIFFSAVILIVTVSSMLIAQHPAIKSVGFATLTGMLSAVIIAYVLQPAIFKWMKKKN